MPLKTKPFDAAGHLDEAMSTGNIRFIAKSLGEVARAHGMTAIAKKTGLSRESLYRALAEDGNPEFATVLAVLSALKMRLHVTPQEWQ